MFNIRLLALLIITALMVPGVYGFDCLNTISDFAPTERLTFICSDVNAEECYSYVYDSDPTTQLINALPGTNFNKIEAINGFRVNNNFTIIEVSTKYLRDNTNYTVGVVCGEYTEEYNYSLGWTNGNAPVRGMVYLIRGAYWFVGTLLFVLIVGAIIIQLYNYYKYERG